jgi:hypothetical protein
MRGTELRLTSMLIPRPQWVHAPLLGRLVMPLRFLLSLFIKDYTFEDIENNPDVVFG